MGYHLTVFDQTPALLREGYLFLANRRLPGADLYEVHVLGVPATCMVGADAAQLTYDQSRFQRAGVLPGTVRRTLTGDGAVQGLDGTAHRHRKAVFMNLVTPKQVEALAQRTVGAVAARRRGERWLTELMEQVRRKEIAAPAGSPIAVMAGHRGMDGSPLASRTAAAELLNLIRPTVAIAWFVAFAAHALHMYPQWLVQLRGRGRAELTWFAQELRRFYPFAPAVGAKVREELEWRGHRLPRGGLVLLDLYGTSHDPRRWPEPDRFDRLPPQDLAIPPRRIPTRPRSGVVLSEVRQVTAGATGRSPRRFGRAGTGNR